MSILSVNGLCKTYPAFRLEDVTFSVEAGTIMGFIGRNGAGKTTTLKSLLGLVHPDAGSVECFGMDFTGHEQEVKQRIGYVVSTDGYYKKKRSARSRTSRARSIQTGTRKPIGTIWRSFISTRRNPLHSSPRA